MTFEEALEAQMRVVEGDVNPKRFGGIIDTFAEIIKRAIAATGLISLTEDEFVAIVTKAFAAFAVSMGLGPIVVGILTPVIETIARNIYRKRINPAPSPA